MDSIDHDWLGDKIPEQHLEALANCIKDPFLKVQKWLMDAQKQSLEKAKNVQRASLEKDNENLLPLCSTNRASKDQKKRLVYIIYFFLAYSLFTIVN